MKTIMKAFAFGSGSILVANTALAVISGTPVNSSDPIAATSVAFIQNVVSNTEYPGGIEKDPCSGTIFSSDTILTAAHCIKESPVGKFLSFGVNVYSSDSITRQIDNYAVDPDYQDGYANQPVVPKNNSDIAVLHFTGGVPQGFRPADMLPSTYLITGKEQVVIGGYGIVKHPEVDSNGFVIDPYAWLGDGILRKAAPTIFDPAYAPTEIKVRESVQSYASTGDSGGPAFVVVGNEPLFFGVDNWGDRQDGTPFEVYADARSHLAWINSAIAGFHK